VIESFETSAIVVGGRLKFAQADREALDRALHDVPDGTTLGLRLESERQKRATRTARANRYYWGCVLTPMSKDASAGDQSPEEIHDAMCAMFLPDQKKRIEFVNRMTGESLTVDTDPRRSSRLRGDEFFDFVEQVRKFALEFMNIQTADPDPKDWRAVRRT